MFSKQLISIVKNSPKMCIDQLCRVGGFVLRVQQKIFKCSDQPQKNNTH